VRREQDRLYRWGGISLIGSGILMLAKHLLELSAGPQPSRGVEILAWVEAGRLPLMLANEALFVSAMLLIPGVIALHASLARVDRTGAAIGCGILTAAIPVLLALDIVHGRLVYAVYGLRIDTPAIAELAVALFHGGLHATSIMIGFATLVLALAMRRGPYGRGLAALGLVTGVFDVVGAFPWAIGPALLLACHVLYAAWFLAVGWRLCGLSGLRPPYAVVDSQGDRRIG
jgi:hypothetical protein